MRTWDELEARRDELRDREALLRREIAAMEPAVAARAFRTLADEKDALAAEYEAFLKSKQQGD